jgi:hypothetical protein
LTYEIQLVNPKTNRPIQLERREILFNIPLSYEDRFKKVLGPLGIRKIYGMKAADTLSILRAAANNLKDNIDNTWWFSTEGNARLAIFTLISLARLCPSAVWKGT